MRTGPGYCATTKSTVRRVIPSTVACANSTRSNGSLWMRGRLSTEKCRFKQMLLLSYLPYAALAASGLRWNVYPSKVSERKFRFEDVSLSVWLRNK